MQAKREFRDRDSTQVAVLDALVDRAHEGMSVLEIRAHVDAEIDDLEDALSELKSAGLIEVDSANDRTVIYPHDRAVPQPAEGQGSESLLERLKRRLPFP